MKDYGCTICSCIAGNLTCSSNPKCSCVNEETGENVTAGETFTKRDNCTVCECASGRVMCDSSQCLCDYKDKEYRDGDCFPAGDGCNTCSCIDTVVTCTERTCRK